MQQRSLRVPEVEIFNFARSAPDTDHVLPNTHSIAVFEAILNRGLDLADVWFEVVAMTLLTVAFFAFGTLVFSQRHMSADTV